jgi:hypothetical protein
MAPQRSRWAVFNAFSYCGTSDERDSGYGRQRFLEELRLLGDQILELRGQSREVAPGAREARDQTRGDWIDQDDEDHGDRARRLLHDADRMRPGRDDDVDLELNELGGERRDSLSVPVRPPIFDRHGLALGPAQLAEPLSEGFVHRAHRYRARRIEKSDSPAGNRLRFGVGRGERESKKDGERDQAHGAIIFSCPLLMTASGPLKSRAAPRET